MIHNAHPENEKEREAKNIVFKIFKGTFIRQLELELGRRFPRELLHCSLLAHKKNTNTEGRYLQMN